MAYLTNKYARREQYTWPGFVDALATLLMVVIFVLMIFYSVNLKGQCLSH